MRTCRQADGRGNERNGFQLFRELSVVSRGNEARGHEYAEKISSTCMEADSGRSQATSY